MAWIRQKSEPDTGTTPAPTSTSVPKQQAAPEPQRASHQAPRRESHSMESMVNIGQSVEIKGELTGNEDLSIEGKVDGKIMLKDHNLTIGANGRITAEVHAKTVVVLGTVTGNISADDKVELAPSGSVNGDIRAPRVAIADGARFKGSIDMEGASKPAQMPRPQESSSSSQQSSQQGHQQSAPKAAAGGAS